MILSFSQLRDLAASTGFPDPALAAAVAMGESYGHSDAENIVVPSLAAARTVADPSHPVGPEWSVGIWQINACSRWDGDTCASWRYDKTRLFDATYNAQVAYAISNGGTTWRPWGAFTNGSYKQFLPPGYVPPVATPPQPTPTGTTITPPVAQRSSVVAVLGGAALAAAAGYAAYRVRTTI